MNPGAPPVNNRNSDRLWVTGQSVLMLAVILLGVLHSGARHDGTAFATGMFLFLAGAVAGIWGVRSLGRSRTPFPTPKADAELVQRGIYHWLRHPLYSSVMLASVGWALIWESRPAGVSTVILCVFFDAKARVEERLLLAKFPEYAAYRKRTWRFLPGIY